eukprot:gene14748-20796_t
MSDSGGFDPTKYSTAALAGLLGLHIAEKGWQVGSLLGLGIVVPVAAVVFQKRDVQSFTKMAAYSAVGLCGVASAAGAVKIAKFDRAGFEDRANNAGQNRTDIFSAAGMVAGALASSFLLRQTGVVNIIGGASLGSAVGVLVHAAIRPAEQREPSQLANILKE